MTGLAYGDTSAMPKLYLQEPGSAHAAELARNFECASCELMPVELRGALHRRRMGGDSTPRQHCDAERRIAANRMRWRLSPIGAVVLGRAEQIVTAHRVRALDAVHVAAALEVQAALESGLPFFTADRRQAEVATALGLQVTLVGAA